MKVSKRILGIVTLLLWAAVMGWSDGTMIPAEEQWAPIQAPAGPAVRYWQLESGTISTIDPEQHLQIKVPQRANPKLLVVMYHNLVFGRTGNIYNRDIYNFEHDLTYLRKNFQIIDFSELADIAEGRSSLQTDAAIITFDDGDLSMYALAYPLLKRLHIKATFCIVPHFVGEVGYMNWDQIKEMADYKAEEGMYLFSFASHSLTHRPLGDLSGDELFWELDESKRTIEAKIERTVDVLALPFGSGRGDKEVLAMARQAGYRIIRTSQVLSLPLDAVNLLDVPAFNVENYSTDVFIRKARVLVGR